MTIRQANPGDCHAINDLMGRLIDEIYARESPEVRRALKANFTSKALEELHELGEKYRLLMRNANEIIVMTNTSAEIVECNKAMFDISGYGADEVMGREIFGFMAPGRREEAKKTFCGVLKGEITKIPDMPYIKKNGEVIQKTKLGKQG